MPEPVVIAGTVRLPDDESRSGITVIALDRDLPSRERIRGPQVLGESICDAEGRFEIEADPAGVADGEARPRSAPDVGFQAFDRGRRELTVRAVEADGAEVGPDLIVFNVAGRLEVVLHLAPADHDAESLSEYEVLTAAVAPVIGEISAADLSDDDLGFLRRELAGVDTNHLALLRAATYLSRAEGVSPVAFYGWARLGVPDLWAELPSFDVRGRRDAFVTRVLDDLAATEAARLIETLRRAVEERVIPDEYRERADALGHLLRRRVLVPMTVRVRLVAEGSDEIRLGSHLVAVRDDGAGGRDLGEDVTDVRGDIDVTYDVDPADPAAPRALRLTVSGPALAARVELAVQVRPPSPEDVDSSAGIDPVATVVRVPLPARSGDLAALTAGGHLQLSGATVQRLRAAGVTTLADVRRAGGAFRIAALAEADRADVRRLDALTDLDRVTTELAEAAVLVSSGYESVIAIANASWATFLAHVAPERDDVDGAARLTYEQTVRVRASAQAQVGYLDLMVAGVAADLANGSAQ